MNHYIIDENYLLPKIKILKSMVTSKGKTTKSGYLKFLKSSWDEFRIETDDSIIARSYKRRQQDLAQVAIFTLNHCSHLIPNDIETSTRSPEYKSDLQKIKGSNQIFECKTIDMNENHPMFIFLEKYNIFFSTKTLTKVINIGEAITKHCKEKKESLESIFSKA